MILYISVIMSNCVPIQSATRAIVEILRRNDLHVGIIMDCDMKSNLGASLMNESKNNLIQISMAGEQNKR